MPDKETAGVDLDQYQKEKDEFNNALNELLEADEGKSDEEITAELDGKKSDDTGEDGKSKKDQVKDDDQTIDKAVADELLGKDSQKKDADTSDDTDDTNDTDDTDVDWKKKAQELEAELEKERQKTSSWNGRITAANNKVKKLEKELEEARQTVKVVKADPDAESDTAVLERFRTDFPELTNVIDIIMRKVDGVSGSQAKDTADDFDAGDTDNTKGASDDSPSPEVIEHRNKINAAHPDLGEMVQTGVLLTWINTQPEYIRPTLQTIYQSGNADQVIKMVNEFKKTTGWESQLKVGKRKTDNNKAQKLNSMGAVDSESGGTPTDGPDKNDYEGAAKEAGL